MESDKQLHGWNGLDTVGFYYLALGFRPTTSVFIF
jgi:hypothetical protein